VSIALKASAALAVFALEAICFRNGAAAQQPIQDIVTRGDVTAVAAQEPQTATGDDLTVVNPGWSGLYAGINAGGNWGSPHTSVTTTTTFVNTAALSAIGQTYGPAAAASANGNLSSGATFIGGGQIGYNFPLAPRWVAGFEADLDSTPTSNASFTDTVERTGFPGDTVQTTASVTKWLNFLSTVRGRVGYLVDPYVLIYGTAGLAIGNVSSSTVLSATEIPNTGSTNINASGSSSRTMVGYAGGAGAEWLVSGDWSLKAEYLYYHLGSISYNNAPFSAFLISNGAIDNTANSVTKTKFGGSLFRVAVSYHF
jgi:outer membrane immunogenic protein